MQEISSRPRSTGRLRVTEAPVRSEPAAGGANMAGFFDWSNDVNQCIQVSKYSAPAAGFPSRIEGNAKKNKLKQWYSTNGAKLANITAHSGRLFHREKTSITKGERRIIEGICQNRGMKDVKEEQKCDLEVESSQLISHKDAWLIGRQVPRARPLMKVRHKGQNMCFCDETYTLANPRKSVSQDNNQQSDTTICFKCGGCILVFNEKDSEFEEPLNFSRKRDSLSNGNWPPVITETPTKCMTPHKKIPPINSGQGVSVVKEVLRRSSINPHSLEKKTIVDIYLPRMMDCRAAVPSESSSRSSSRMSDCEIYESRSDTELLTHRKDPDSAGSQRSNFY